MKKKLRACITLFVALAMVMAMGASAFAAGVSSNDAALKKALKNAGLKKSQVNSIEVEYDKKDGVYEIEFIKKKNKAEYEYEISAGTGEIVKKAVDYRVKKNSSRKKIGKAAARKKVAKSSGISYKVISKGSCSYEYDDGKGVYEIKFSKGDRRYEYDVLAPTGKVLEFEWKVKGSR